MRVLFYESRPEWGGAQKCELDLIVSLHRFGMETYFVASSNGPMVGRLQHAGKEVRIIPVSEAVENIRKQDVKSGLFFTVKQALKLVPHFIKVLQLIYKENIEVIYTSQFRSQLIIGWLAKLACKKVIWHIHGEENLDNLLGKISVRFSDKIIVVSNKLKETYQSIYPSQREKFVTVYNGIDLPPTNLKKSDTDPIVLTIVGTLVEGKRQDLAVKACAALNQLGLDVSLNIVGDKPHWLANDYKQSLINLVNSNHVSKKVDFMGWLENPIPVLRQSDIFILPSDTEGLPLSIIEAMAVGLPCVATDVGGIAELIDHGITGLLVKPDDLNEFVESIKTLIQDPKLRLNMGKMARKKYESSFTRESFLRGVAGVIAPNS